jgi:hypothetical protein
MSTSLSIQVCRNPTHFQPARKYYILIYRRPRISQKIGCTADVEVDRTTGLFLLTALLQNFRNDSTTFRHVLPPFRDQKRPKEVIFVFDVFLYAV